MRFLIPHRCWGIALSTRVARAASCIGALLALGFASLASAANAVRISQVYGGGSGPSAPYNADFVELYNSGASSVSIAGWTITYTSTTGTYGGNQFTFPAGASIPAGSYLCVQMQATGTVGAAVPFDFIAATAIDLSATAGNVALLTAAQTGSNNTCASLAATLVDKVAFGGGNCPEGTAASTPATTTAIIRKGNGATDTDANSSDFFVATPYPRNLSFTKSVIATTGSTLAADGWTLASSGTVSSGIASSDGNGGTNGLAGNQAWSLGAATGASITATRAITTAAGMVVALDFDNGTVASSTSTGIEFLSGTTTALKFQLTGGSANYSIVDSAGTVATTLAATTSGVRVSVLLSASGAYTLTAGAYTRSGTLAGSATTFSSIRVFDTAVGTTAATLVYFNHLRVGFNSLTSTVTAGSIPDNSTVGRVVSFPMTATQIPAGTAVRDVRVTLTGLAHQNAGDVSAVVIAPDGTSSPLFIRPGATNSGGTGADVANFTTDYSFADSAINNLWTATSGTTDTPAAAGWYFPSVLFTGARSALSSAFAGKDPVGTWQVKVTDLATGTTGTLTSATLELRLGADSDGDDAADIFDGCPSNGALLAPATYYIDADNDGYGSTTTTTSCASTPPAGTSANSTDCNDASAAINPGATELCDGIDQNCNGILDDGFADADGDGVGNCVDTNLTYTIAGAAIPDATAATPNVPGVLNKTFVVTSGQIPGGITDVRVTFVGLTHTYVGDISASLIAPNGTTTALIIGRVGATAAVPFGDASDYGGNYAFFDAATASIWTAAAAAGTTAIIPAGSYYPSTTLTGARVALTNAFTGVVAAGTWTVRLTDSTNLDVGSVTTIIVDLTPVLDSDGDGTPDASDGCPNDPNKIAAGTCGCGVAETDSDADGTPNCIDACPNDPNKIAAGACGCGAVETDSDSDGTPNCIDACPNDANKIAAGACGCGSPDVDANTNGTIDCLEITPTVSITVVGGGSSFGAGDTFTVRVAHSNPGRNISQARLSIGYNASALLPLSVQPTAGSPFSEQVSLQISEANGTIRTITRAPNGSGAAANDSDITFVVLPGANVCSASGVVNFTTVAGNSTQLVSVDGGLLNPTLTPLGLIRADGLAPVFSGIPNSVSIPTDAGSTAGAVISAPVTSASDNCDGARAVTISVLYPDATTGNAWPVNDLFPVGTSVVTFATGDSVGNNTSTSRTVEVGNYQYLDVAITLGGTVSGNSTRPIRISVGSTLTVVNVSMTGASGAISNFQVLATQTPPCVAVKDTNHSIATANIASVVGTEYALSVVLTQGDSNDDNRIDILDFGQFVASRGATVATNAISNFNADTIVNNSDLSFISVNFFHIGDTCGSYTGDPALERIKVKDLRRAGMGHLDIADLNHDGWLDSGDIAYYLQFGGPTGPSARPGTETGVQSPR